MLTLNNVEVVYQSVILVLKGVSLEVPDGSLVCLLGANGAGKSTTIGIICSLVNKSSGKVSIFGHDLGKRKIYFRKKKHIFRKKKHIFLERVGNVGNRRKKKEKSAEGAMHSIDFVKRKRESQKRVQKLDLDGNLWMNIDMKFRDVFLDMYFLD